jgi:hypothetical protein
MSNIVRSFIEEFVPGWASRDAIRRAAEPAVHDEPAAEIQMPVDVPMPQPDRPRERGPHRPRREPSHWRAPNM